jgi:phosphoenolpyruvate synthase/pyruvate phosphate dikinase
LTGGLVRPLSALRAADEPRFGGKSAGLGELLAAGIRVPPGFALACEALELAGPARRVPPAVRDELAAAHAELEAATGLAQPPVAVRSSAIGEDSSEATFAGQMQTLLWVRGLDQICAAIERCWESLYGDEAVAYRAHLGRGTQAAMGVAVQLMVDAAVAGVLFTCNPLSGDPSMVAINASWGLGEAVVGGEVTPDDYLVSKVTREVVRERVAPKEVEYVTAPGGQGTVKVQVAPQRRERPCLDAAGLQALVDVARAAERHFGCHQDVEWAIARTGAPPDNVFVVQSRPVTVVPERPTQPAPASAIALVMGTFGIKPSGG